MEQGQIRVGFAANGEVYADQRGNCFRWRVKAGTNEASPTLERLDLIKPAGFVSLCLRSNGVVFTAERGSRLVSYENLSNQDNTPWVRTVDGLNGSSPDERWLAMFRPFGSFLEIYRSPGFEHVVTLTNEGRIARFEFSPVGRPAKHRPFYPR